MEKFPPEEEEKVYSEKIEDIDKDLVFESLDAESSIAKAKETMDYFISMNSNIF